jgi:hypothetical protein
MKKTMAVGLVLLMSLAMGLAAQNTIVEDTFSVSSFSQTAWTRGFGDWAVRSGRLVQGDWRTGLARADRQVEQGGVMDVRFRVRYIDGGYDTDADIQNEYYHAGFGIHIGVDQAARGVAWGNGRSYLLWLNLDLRPEVMDQYPEHVGFRGQVYRSDSNSRMELVDELNVDIGSALGLTTADIVPFLDVNVPVRVVFDTNSGRVRVYDPTAPETYFYFDLDPALLQGNYISLRTNSLAASFDNFEVIRR